MAFQPQRFVHAANLRLDVPVSVQTSETFSDELRLAFEDATLFAFDEVIECCIRRDVDFLLLSGNAFVEADRSLRARLVLLKGFRRLQEFGIQVFVLPGDTDPPEAWRSIPDVPDNVTVCYSSNPEPMEMYLNDELATTVSASIWFGKADDFGIQVLATSAERIQPFRIGVVSQAKYQESQKMAAMAASAADDTIPLLNNPASGEQAGKPEAESGNEESTVVLRSIDADAGERPRRLETSRPRRNPGMTETIEIGPDDALSSFEPGFVRYLDEMLREGQLNYLALTGELGRTTIWRDSGVIHCPGTTQPRNHLEASGGVCSLVEVSAAGEVRISPLDTSSVDWKHIEVDVEARTTLSSMLQRMKTRLIEVRPGTSDRIWSVHWTLRGAIPVLKSLAAEDLEMAAAVELDELTISGRTIRLLHDIRNLPLPWPTDESESSLASQYQAFISRSRLLSDESLQTLLDADTTLTAGWKQRFSSMLASLDPELILARLRHDGAAWFEPDFGLAEAVEDEVSQDDDATAELMTDDETSDDEVTDDENDDMAPGV